MNAELMVSPSSLMDDGIKLEKVDNLHLFKFSDRLQARSDDLLERSHS